jgi:hypothetical protein
MSTGLAAPDSRDPLSCAKNSSLDPLETRSGPCVGNQSRSYSGVARLLDGDRATRPTTGRVRLEVRPTQPILRQQSRWARREVGLISDYNRTGFFHFLIAERSARAKL